MSGGSGSGIGDKRERSAEDTEYTESTDSANFKQIKRQQKKHKKSHAAATTTNKPTMSFDLNQINRRNNRYAIHVGLHLVQM